MINTEKNAREKSANYKEEFDSEIWTKTDTSDIWIFDKLILARISGHTCGPRGSMVPVPGEYFVRPIMNTFGMGLMARVQHIDKYAEDMHPAEFWCELFRGRHISVDYENGEQILAVEGTKHEEKPFQRFVRWEKVSEEIPVPSALLEISKKYKYMNCEFIGGKLIEVHLRRNYDFAYGNSIMIPDWGDESTPSGTDGMTYIRDEPGCPSGRVGIFVS